MSKEKICHVCQAFIDRNYIPEMVLHINKLIKLKTPVEVLNKESEFNFKYYRYKLHREQCLINFEIPIEEQKIELEENIKNNEIEIKNIEEFDNLKFIEKHNKRREILNRISYKLLLKIDNDKYISKEEVSTLKTLNDLINQNYIENIYNIDNLKDIDKFGFNLFKTIITYQNYTIDQSIDLIKLIPLIKNNFNIEEDNKELTPEEKEAQEEFISRWIQFKNLKEKGVFDFITKNLNLRQMEYDIYYAREPYRKEKIDIKDYILSK